MTLEAQVFDRDHPVRATIRECVHRAEAAFHHPISQALDDAALRHQSDHEVFKAEQINHLQEEKVREHPQDVFVGLIADNPLHLQETLGLGKIREPVAVCAGRIRQRIFFGLAESLSEPLVDDAKLVLVTVVAFNPWLEVRVFLGENPLEVVAVFLDDDWRAVTVKVVRHAFRIAELDGLLHQCLAGRHGHLNLIVISTRCIVF